MLKRAKRVQFLSEKHHVLHHVFEPLYRRNAVLIGLWTLAYKLKITFRKECLSLKGPLYDNLLANQRRTPSGCGIALIINRQPWNHSPACFVFVWSREPFRMICFRVVSCLLPTCFRSLRLPWNRLVHPPHASAIPSNKERHLEISVLNYVILCPDFCVNSIDIWL